MIKQMKKLEFPLIKEEKYFKQFEKTTLLFGGKQEVS